MNGNDLNNMAKRYKEEMMRLYQKSGASSNTSAADNNGGIMGQGAGMSGKMPMPNHENSTTHTASRDIAGTPVHGVPGASFYSTENTTPSCSHQEHEHHKHNTTKSMQVECDCRFPSAESIINSIAQTPMTLLSTENNTVSPVECTPIQPREAVAANTAPASSTDNGDVRLHSIILNMTPESATYTFPSQNDAANEVIPDFALPADLPADADGTIPSTASFYPSQAWISLTGDNSWGFLQIEVFTSEGEYPIQGAIVIIRKILPSGVGLLRILFTNSNGKTPVIALPAPAIMLPTTEGIRPFSEYEITVIARGYYTLSNIKVPIYAGSKLVQPVDMMPLPNYNYPTYPPQPRGISDNTVG